MKKILLGMTVLVAVIFLSACGSKEKLYVLNWGDYMNPDIVEQFKKEFDVEIVYDEAGSNEEMEVKIKAGTTAYDIAFPSDYMIDKLSQEGYLNKINYSSLEDYEEGIIKQEVADLTKDKDYNDYFVPYFWGTIGIMYNIDSVDETVLTEKGWGALFDPLTPYKIGMYDSARDASAAALLHLGYDVNTSDENELNEAKALLAAGVYEVFGEDDLKGKVHAGNLDMALVYSGDYFDEMYTAEEDGEEPIPFRYFVPESTNIWVDGFVIPTTSENTDLAYEFINFFFDLDVASENADWVGYAPVTDEAYDLLVSDDWGYGEYDNYDPYPVGSTRVIYEYVGEDRFSKLNELLDAAKGN